jgi:UDP-N-acetylmuramate dehydrogenase
MDMKILNWQLPNVCLGQYLYYQVGKYPALVSMPSTWEEAQQSLWYAHKHGLYIGLVGDGTNVALGHLPQNTMLLKMDCLRQCFLLDTNSAYVESGNSMLFISQFFAKQGWQGGEWAYRLPGTVGAAIRMNASCFGGFTANIVQGVWAMDRCGYIRYLDSKDIFFGYKNTLFMEEFWVILGAIFINIPQTNTPQKRYKWTHKAIVDQMLYCETARLSKQHFNLPSCGSTFKNNYNIGKPSGVLIEELGYKGHTIGGGFMVSNHHGNFIWNTLPNGLADIYQLLQFTKQLREQVQSTYGDTMALELEFIGTARVELAKSNGLSYTIYKESNTESQNTSDMCSIGLQSPIVHTTFVSKAASQNSVLPNFLFAGPFVCMGQGIDTQMIFHTSTLGYTTLHIDPTIDCLVWRFSPHNACHGSTDATIDNRTTRTFVPLATTPTDQLWQGQVFELFIAHPHTQEYMEIEIKPVENIKHTTVDWLCFTFNGVRHRTNIHQDASLRPEILGNLYAVTTNIEAENAFLYWELQLPKQTIQPYVHIDSSGRAIFKFGIAWNQCHNPNIYAFHKPVYGPPNFHCLDSFSTVGTYTKSPV